MVLSHPRSWPTSPARCGCSAKRRSARVAGLFKIESVDEAIELANATEFGLGSNAWTTDPAEQDAFIRGIEAGAVFVNGMTASYSALPFGGVKRSGYGRELAEPGIKSFCNAKTVWVAD